MISVVITAYNCEKYLQKCLLSVIQQQNVPFEILIVDDGSRDGTLSIIKQYAECNNNVSYISQTNAGLAAARNAGIKMAKGEWLFFLDGDDELPPDALESLWKNASHDVDSVVSTISVLYDSDAIPKLDENWYRINWSGLKQVKVTELFNFHCSACGKLFRKSIIDKYNLRFPEGCWYEDWYWHFCYYLCAPSVYCVTRPCYNYLRHDDTFTTVSSTTKSGVICQHLDVTQRIIQFAYDTNFVKEIDLIVDRLLEESFLFVLRRVNIPEKYLACYKCAKIIDDFKINVSSPILKDLLLGGGLSCFTTKKRKKLSFVKRLKGLWS